MPAATPKKVAIVHDWLVGGGAEQVVLELHHMFPEAPIYTSYCSDDWRQKLNGKVVTGWLQHWPFSRLRKFIPVLRIWWFGHLNLSSYDLVISSSGNGEAKSIKAGRKFKAGQTHICYCHSPTHFYWRHYEQYMRQPGFGRLDPVVRFALRVLVGPLRAWDRKASQRPDVYIANSEHIKDDIERYYKRTATVVHPPVDIDRFMTEKLAGRSTRHGFVTIGRLQPYKRVDLIVEACAKLKLPLTVVGNGPDYDNLKQLAASLRASRSIKFVTDADNAAVANYMRTAEAFLFASYEDFGITPIEAMAAGTPVIAYRAGGALDYIQPGLNGTFFERQTVESLTMALHEFHGNDYKPALVRETVEKFNAERFQQEMANVIEEAL